MEQVRAAGVLVFRRNPEPGFLLMKHPHRYDLPKGHLESGETDLQCALRELEEETGLRADQIEIDSDFQYDVVYHPRYRRTGGARVHKTVVFYLGWASDEGVKAIDSFVLTEHTGFEWFTWNPPHLIQRETVDELLRAAELHFDEDPTRLRK